MARSSGHRAVELDAGFALADIYRQQGRYDQASRGYRQALAIAEEIDDANMQFEVIHGLGQLSHAVGDQEAALRDLHRALRLAISARQPVDQARAHDGLGRVYQSLARPAPARRHWRAALGILSTLGIDHTEDPATTVGSIRARLAALGPGCDAAAARPSGAPTE